MAFLNLLLLWLITLPGNTVTITLDLRDLKSEKVYFENDSIKDSAIVRNGLATFIFQKTSPEPENLRIYNPEKTLRIDVYVENTNIKISGQGLDAKKLTYEGSETQLQMIEYLSTVEPYNKALTALIKSGASVTKVDSIRKLIISKEMDFTRRHPDSFVSIHLPAMALYRKVISQKQAFDWFQTLSTENRNSMNGQVMLKRIREYRNLKVNDIAPDFTLKDLNGNSVSLSDYKDKSDVLLVFWASWCGPCLAEIPHLKKYYKNNKRRDFEIISVSLDENEKALRAATGEIKFDWPNVFDLKGWYSDIANAYGVSSLPKMFLIAKDGRIIKTDFPITGVYR